MRSFFVALPLALLSLTSLPAEATTIGGAALGSQLAGGTVTVTTFGAVNFSATFVAVGAGAEAVGSVFKLEVSPGDTSLATWKLTNTNPTGSSSFADITTVRINLTLSGISLFDSGSLPSTFDSGTGVSGVVDSVGVSIASSSELNAWTDPSNMGDMYTTVLIGFSGATGIGSQAFSSWTDDTDVIVPEPSTGALLAIGLVALRRRRRAP